MITGKTPLNVILEDDVCVIETVRDLYDLFNAVVPLDLAYDQAADIEYELLYEGELSDWAVEKLNSIGVRVKSS